MASDGTKTGNGTGGDLRVEPGKWHLFEAWDTPGSGSVDFDGGTVHLVAVVDEGNDVEMPLRKDDGTTRTLSGNGNFEFKTGAAVVRPVLAGGGGSEDITYRVRRSR